MVQSPPRRPPRPTLIDLFNIEAQRLRDQRADPAVLRQRDRAIGQQLDDLPGREDRLIAWIRQRQQDDPMLPGHRVARGMRVGTLGLCLAAGVLGMIACGSALAYSGRYPVNVLGFLGVLILPQILLILGWAVTMLPARRLRAVPLVADLQAVLRSLSPGRLVAWLTQRGARHAWHDQADQVMAVLQATRQRYGEIVFLALSQAAQLAGICFNLGAIAAFVALVIFTDLAFGWSTTLQWDARRVHDVTSIVAAPWSWAWPQALPTRELVALSQYYRLDDPSGAVRSDPAALGGWWPFLLACLVTYGLLPRMMAVGFVAWRKRRLLGRVTFDHPDHLAALLRLQPVVQTAAMEPSRDQVHVDHPEPAASPPQVKTPCRLLNWRAGGWDQNELAGFLQQRLGYEVISIHTAPGRSAAADQAALAQCAAPAAPLESANAGPLPVVVVAKAWESPSRDLRRSLGWLRDRLGPAIPITVCLVDQNEPHRPAAPLPDDVRIWQRKLRELGDAQLFVVAYQAKPFAESPDA